MTSPFGPSKSTCISGVDMVMFLSSEVPYISLLHQPPPMIAEEEREKASCSPSHLWVSVKTAENLKEKKSATNIAP